ncbi:MAG: Calx-beta domain-containing protein [Myxococcota bacterium]
MRKPTPTSRSLFFLLAFASTGSASAFGLNTPLVISEVRTRGSSGTGDEFVEIYNNTGSDIDISGYQLQLSDNAGMVITTAVVTGGTILPARRHFLFGGTGYDDAVTADQSFIDNLVDDGGVALVMADGITIADQVGFSADSAFQEGAILTPLVGDVDQSYERLPGGWQGGTLDTDDNASDFQFIASSDPQNLASPSTPGPGDLQFSSATYSVSEDGGSATITVTRVNGTAGMATVDYATSDGTATAGSDYTASSGTLAFADGETSKTFSVPIWMDSNSEGDETIFLTLSNPSGGAALGTPDTAVLTVVDVATAGSLQLSAATYSIGENGGSATITVTRTNGSGGTVTVDYATSDGTATAGADYTASSGTLSFADGETTRTFTVPVRDDFLAEPNETINLALSTPTGGATLGAPSSAVLTVVNVARPVITQGPSEWVLVGDNVVLSASIQPAPVGDTVEFVSDAVVLCSASVDSVTGVATCTWNVDATGNYVVLARNQEGQTSETMSTIAYNLGTRTSFSIGIYARPGVPVDIAVQVAEATPEGAPIADEQTMGGGDEAQFLVESQPRATVTNSQGGAFVAEDLVFDSVGTYELEVRYSGRAHGYAPSGAGTTVTVEDTPPTLIVPSDVTLEANQLGGRTVTWAFSASDSSGIAASACSPASGSFFAVSTTPVTVTCGATDNAGNPASATFTVWVRDTTAPTMTVPANPRVEGTSPSGATVAFAVTAWDVVDGNITPSCTHSSNALFGLGTTTVSCSATDGHGNTVSRSFTVTVRDTRAPIIRINLTTKTLRATSPAGKVVTYTVTVSDAVTPSPTVSCSPLTGATFPVGRTSITCRATDAAGNVGSITSAVVVSPP